MREKNKCEALGATPPFTISTGHGVRGPGGVSDRQCGRAAGRAGLKILTFSSIITCLLAAGVWLMGGYNNNSWLYWLLRKKSFSALQNLHNSITLMNPLYFFLLLNALSVIYGIFQVSNLRVMAGGCRGVGNGEMKSLGKSG